MFTREKEFYKILLSSKGFCLKHYAELLNYSNRAGFMTKQYLSVLSNVQEKNFARVQAELKAFCDSHDYSRAYKPLGDAENALPHARIKFYGENQE